MSALDVEVEVELGSRHQSNEVRSHSDLLYLLVPGSFSFSCGEIDGVIFWIAYWSDGGLMMSSWME